MNHFSFSVFEGVPKFNINLTELKLDVADILAEKTNIFSSKGGGKKNDKK